MIGQLGYTRGTKGYRPTRIVAANRRVWLRVTLANDQSISTAHGAQPITAMIVIIAAPDPIT